MTHEDNEPLQKGNKLEDAVRAIETHILKISPILVENTLTIEGKKIFISEGVRHEIDIYVTGEIAGGYRSTFIFECKNWKGRVGKNEIIVFSEKIAATSAQTGFFVAKSFTKSAISQAEKDKRIKILLATEHDPDLTPVPFHFHFVIREGHNATVHMVRRNHEPTEPFRIDVENAVASLDGEKLHLKEYLDKLINESCNKNLSTFASAHLPAGTYSRESSDEHSYISNKLIINDMDIEAIKIEVSFDVKVVPGAVISHFEVNTRGRSISFAPVAIGNGEINISFATSTTQNTLS